MCASYTAETMDYCHSSADLPKSHQFIWDLLRRALVALLTRGELTIRASEGDTANI